VVAKDELVVDAVVDVLTPEIGKTADGAVTDATPSESMTDYADDVG